MGARHATEQEEWLKAALAELTPKQRFVVKTYWGLYDREHSFPEIAEMIGTTHQAVQLMYARAMKNLGRLAEKGDCKFGSLFTEGDNEALPPGSFGRTKINGRWRDLGPW